MKLDYCINRKIPKLSWCAVLHKGSDMAEIECGVGVEQKEDWFVEGGWCGSFTKGEFEKNIFFLGTGGKCQSDGILFATPNHSLERLHMIEREDRIYVSNSMAFVLAKSNSNFDINYTGYEKVFHSILNGIDKYQKKVPLKETDRKCYVLYYCNVKIDRNFKKTISRKQEHSPFDSYEEYIQSLNQDMVKLYGNLKDVGRRQKYGITTTISRGYDSAACAAVARNLGCNTAVTFDRPEKYAEDEGSKIAEALGYKNVLKKDAEEYLRRSDFTEAEYIAGGELGTGIVFSSFDKEFENKLVFIGEGGDRFWDRNAVDVNAVLRFKDEYYSGSTLLEPRLRIGYIYCPLPFYCAVCWPSLYKISRSAEMKRWTLNNTYDRPIPRRILEEAGVDRDLFGIEKIGAGFNYRYDTLRRLQKRMSPDSYKDFKEFYKKSRKMNARRFWKIGIYFINVLPDYAAYMARKIGCEYKAKFKYIENPLAPSYLFQWSMEKLRSRYMDME